MHFMAVKKPRKRSDFRQCIKFSTKYVKGVPFVNRDYKKGVPFL